MPGPVDQDVYLAVLQLGAAGRRSRMGRWPSSLYELRKVLGWSDDSGGAYREIRDALVRIQLTGVQSSNAFYSAADEQLIADSFNVWSVHFAQRKKKGGTDRVPGRPRNVTSSGSIRSSSVTEAQHLGAQTRTSSGPQDATEQAPLPPHRSPKGGGLSWRTDLFGRDQIPPRLPLPSQIKRALGKAHAELEEKGFLSGVEYMATPACSTASPRPSPADRRRSNSPAPPRRCSP